MGLAAIGRKKERERERKWPRKALFLQTWGRCEGCAPPCLPPPSRAGSRETREPGGGGKMWNYLDGVSLHMATVATRERWQSRLRPGWLARRAGLHTGSSSEGGPPAGPLSLCPAWALSPPAELCGPLSHWSLSGVSQPRGPCAPFSSPLPFLCLWSPSLFAVPLPMSVFCSV